MDASKIRILSDAQSFHLSPDEWHRQKKDSVHYVTMPFQGRSDIAESCKLMLGKLGVGKKSVYDYFYDAKIDANSILLNGLGTSVRGSMQYILNELNHNDAYADFTVYVRTSQKTDDIVRQYIKQNKWIRTKTVLNNYAKYLETCKYLITESYFPYAWIKKEGQVVINIWHGTPLKRLGLLKNGKKSHKNAKQQKNFLCTDYFLYPNDYTKNVMLDSYKISQLFAGKKAIKLGYPRTAGLLGVSQEQVRKIRQFLAPHQERVYAYMPTFRGYLSDELTLEREMKFLTFLDANLKDDQILYVNLHHHIGASLDFSSFRHIRKFPPLIDSYELLTATDALISDYSSVFFDYLILGKQIILHIDDYDVYLKHQGLNMDIAELPFDLAKTVADVVEMLNKGKTYDDSEFRSRMCSYDSLENAEKLCQIVRGCEQGLEFYADPVSKKKKVLFYSEQFYDKALTEFLSKFLSQQKDDTKFEFWVGCDQAKTDKHLKNAYPLLHRFPMIGSVDEPCLSPLGEGLKSLYLSGKIPFSEAIKYLIHEYGIMPIRMYGHTQFDILVCYDVQSPETLISMALSPARKRILFLTEELLNEISGGNEFMRDAVCFASGYCHAVFVQKSGLMAAAENILPPRWKNSVALIEDTGDLHKLLEAACG